MCVCVCVRSYDIADVLIELIVPPYLAATITSQELYIWFCIIRYIYISKTSQLF